MESALVGVLSQAGAWGLLVLFVFWWAKEQTTRVTEANDAKEQLQTLLNESVEKRVSDVHDYAATLRLVTEQQQDAIRAGAESMTAVTVTLEYLRKDGYALSRRPRRDSDTDIRSLRKENE